MFDTSQMADYQRCPRWYQYRYVEGIDFPVQWPEAFYSTHLVHDPLAGWYLNLGDESWSPDWMIQWEKYVKAVGGFPVPWMTSTMAQEIHREFRDQFKGDAMEYEVVMVEKMIPTPIEGFGVKPDVVLKRREGGEIWVMDHKISKHEQKPLTPIIRQFIAQAMAVDAVGVIRNSRQIGKGNAWIREEMLIPDDFRKEWEEETTLAMEQMRRSVETGIYPKHAPDGCYWGKDMKTGQWRMCPAIEICLSGGLREGVIKNLPRVDDPEGYQKEG